MATTQQIIRHTEKWVQQQLAGDVNGHDWWHACRVRTLALHIARKEKANLFITEMAALLHDVADWKKKKGAEQYLLIENFLKKMKVDPSAAEVIMDIVKNISFKGAGVKDRMKSIEGKIVQDADRLDAMGATGIARAFAYGGHAGQPIWDPRTKPVLHSSFAEYKAMRSSTINHFYEKLLLLKDRMHTREGRKIARERHRFMKNYLAVFFKEWKGIR